MMVKPPENAPLTPSPAIALPMMKTLLLCDTAEMRDPSMNIDMTAIYVPLTLKI